MAKENENISKELNELIFTWRIENIHLCWQKNGEELVSPDFTVDWLNASPLSIFLYPRGIPGVKRHMSCFIGQENKNVPLVNIGTKFELYLLDADGSKVQPSASEDYLSIKTNGMFGWARFIGREILTDENASQYIPNETLTLCCRIWCEYELETKDKKEPATLKVFARTRIWKGIISQQMAIYPKESPHQEIGEIRPIMQKRSIAIFSITFDEISGHKSLIINTDAEKNEKIKFAILKLVLFDMARKKVFWQTSYLWHETIKCESIELSSHFAKNTEQYVPKEMFTEKCLYLQCQFLFANGSAVQTIEKADYGNNLGHLITRRLSYCGTRTESPSATALDALKSLYDNPLCHDVIIEGKNYKFKVHDMILSSRSETLKKKLSKRDKTTNIVPLHDEDDDTLQRMLYFLYTDTILDMHWEIAKRMYKAAVKYKIELLKEKCFKYIKRNICTSNVCDVVLFTEEGNYAELQEHVKAFIIENHSDVFGSKEWRIFSKSHPSLAIKYMMAKIKLK